MVLVGIQTGPAAVELGEAFLKKRELTTDLPFDSAASLLEIHRRAPSGHVPETTLTSVFLQQCS